MRKLIVGLAVLGAWGLLALSGVGWGQAAAAADLELTGADRGAIERTIRTQLEAFQRDDAAAAFALAAPAIRELFGTPENFLAMVRSGYAAVYRPREVEFRDLVTIEDIVVQQVLVVGPDGRPQIALYTMERQPGGAWAINGCTLVATPQKTT